MSFNTKPDLLYDVNDKPPFGKLIIFAFQQLLAIISATIAVPMIVGHGLSPAAALFGAGAATLVYLVITRFRSPMFFGSSFAFIGSMCTAFAGASSAALGYLGIIIGTSMVALLNIGIGLLIRKFGVAWIYKILPNAVIGPIVAIIGLSLAGTAIGGIWTAIGDKTNKLGEVVQAGTNKWLCLGIAIVTLFATMNISMFAKGLRKLIPFAIGIGIGYTISLIFTGFGYWFNNDALKVIDFTPFQNMEWYPHFTFIKAIDGFKDFNWPYLGTIALAFIPVAVCTMAEHIADHENLSTIIGHDLLKDPGLHRTMIGDGAADFVGAFFGGVSTTSYGESLATTALTKNASTITILAAAIMAMVVSFIGPFNAFLSTIPSCVLNAVCILLYGFIAVSGLKMLKTVNLEDNRNVFTVSVILICGIGGFVINIMLPSGNLLSITEIACALILGIATYWFCGIKTEKPTIEYTPYDPTWETDTVITFDDKPASTDTSNEE